MTILQRACVRMWLCHTTIPTSNCHRCVVSSCLIIAVFQMALKSIIRATRRLITFTPHPPNTHRALMIRRPPTHCQETQAALCAVHSQQHPFIDCIQIKMHLWNSRPGSEHLELSNHQQPVNSMAAQLHTEPQLKIIIIEKTF